MQPTIEKKCYDRSILSCRSSTLSMPANQAPTKLSPYIPSNLLVSSLPVCPVRRVNLPAASARSIPSNLAVGPDRAPSEVTPSASSVNRPRRFSSLVTDMPGGLIVPSPQDAQQKAPMMQCVICHSHVGRHRSFSSQISPDQNLRLLLKPNRAGRLTGNQEIRNATTARPGRSPPTPS